MEPTDRDREMAREWCDEWADDVLLIKARASLAVFRAQARAEGDAAGYERGKKDATKQFPGEWGVHICGEEP